MATIYEGSIDEECIRYEHHSLVLFYLEQSERHSKKAMENHNEGLLQSDSISAIVFAGMTIEAFINEVAENIYEKEQLKDFSFLKGEFKKKGKSSSIIKKLIMLFEKAHNANLPQSLHTDIEDLILLRNNLVHYKLSETSTKIIYPPMQQTKVTSGGTFTTIDFMQEPKKVIPPFIQKISGNTAIKSYNTALNTIKYWNQQRD